MNILIIKPNDFMPAYISNAFGNCFANLGHKVTIEQSYRPGFDICWVPPFHCRPLLPKDFTYKIAYNWEDLGLKMWYRNALMISQYFDCLWDCSLNNLKYRLPIKHLHCPIGYDSIFERPYVEGNEKKVSFLGYTPTKQRTRRLEIIRSIEQKNNIQVWRVQKKKRKTSPSQMDDVIHNSQIHLNIHYNPKSIMFESVRVIALLLSNNCFVISEKSCDSPLVDGQHYVETDNFPDIIKFYLEHPEKCKQIAQQGYDFIKNNYRLRDFVVKCLKEI